MYAMQIEALTGAAALVRVELPEPTPGPGQLRIEVRAIGCNFADILICEGRYQLRPELPFAPGSEVAGVVQAVGPGVEHLRPGDRVLAFVPYGGYASQLLASARDAYRLTDAVPFEDAVALGVAYQTAYFALVERTALRAGETLLVQAAAGGVGLAAVQLGVALGARVIGTASSQEKLALIRAQGAFEALNYRDEGWHERVRELTDGRGADVIYESVGGEVFDLSTRCVAFSGRIVIVGFSSRQIPSVQLNRVMLKNIAVVGLNWGAYREHAPAQVQQASDALMALYAQGALRPQIHGRYPLIEAAKVLQALADRQTVGKLVLIP